MNTSYPHMPPALLERYLRVLGIPRRAPGSEALGELVQAHLLRIPFENVSKLYYKKQRGLRRPPSLELFLEGIEHLHFGGTCYSNNYYLYQLLANLGYQAQLCGADMSNPDVHLVSLVTLEGREYLIDGGYAAPLLRPMPRDLPTDYTVALGRDRYVLKPQDAQGRSRMEYYRDGALKHGYLAKPTPRAIAEFEGVIADSYRDEATFMNSLLLARFFPDHSLMIHNLTVIEARGAESTLRTLTGPDELTQAIEAHFAIPGEITNVALSGLTHPGEAWT